MELPHIGLACTICNRNDYLPFKCTSCAKIVCIDHRADHGSECPLNQTSYVIADRGAPSESLKQACDFCRKITLKLELSQCPHCPGNHCLYHRHQAQHECVQLAKDKLVRDQENAAKLRRQQEALDRLKATIEEKQKPQANSKQQQQQQQQQQQPPQQQNETSKPSGTVAAGSAKSSALARRVRLMKMKQSASCPKGLVHDTSIQTDQDKLYLEVKFLHEPKSGLSQASSEGKSVNIWTSPKWSVGQTLDYPAHLLNLPNKNHIEGCDRLVLKRHSHTSNELVELDNKALFQRYLDLGELESGDVLYLTYAPQAAQ